MLLKCFFTHNLSRKIRSRRFFISGWFQVFVQVYRCFTAINEFIEVFRVFLTKKKKKLKIGFQLKNHHPVWLSPLSSLSATKGLTAQTQKEAMNSIWIFSYLCSDAPNKIRGVNLWVNIVSRSRSGDPPQNSGIRESRKELKEFAKDNSSIYFSAVQERVAGKELEVRSGSHYLWPPKNSSISGGY